MLKGWPPGPFFHSFYLASRRLWPWPVGIVARMSLEVISADTGERRRALMETVRARRSTGSWPSMENLRGCGRWADGRAILC